MPQLNKITLISISDGKNIESSRKSIEGFMKYNGPNVIGVNTQLSSDFENMCKSLGASVFTPHKKYGYPTFTADQYEEHVDFFYTTTLKPAMMADTEYVMFSEPDCVFCGTINRNILADSDIIIPRDCTERKVMWAFDSIWHGYGVNTDEILKNINLLFDSLKIVCKHVNLDFDAAGRKDMRFLSYGQFYSKNGPSDFIFS
jgi:hypothetical protein